MFISFTNFYWRFIQGFSRIAAPLTFLLKTIGSSEKLALKAFRADNNKVAGVGGRADETVINLSKNKKSRKSTCVPNIGVIGEPNFLASDAKEGL